MSNDKVVSFSERLEAIRAAKGEAAPAAMPPAPKPPKIDPALAAAVADSVPDWEDNRSETDIQVENLINSLSFVEAWDKWHLPGKVMDMETRNRDESIMISCPKPTHPDKHPSAWGNREGTWFCGGCQEGGDIYDLAAYAKGYDVPGYKNDGHTFLKLREDMAADFGLVVERTSTFDEIVYAEPDTKAAEIALAKQAEAAPVAAPMPPPPSAAPAPQPETKAAPPTPPAPSVPAVVEPEPETVPDNVTELPSEEFFNLDEGVFVYPTLRWQNIVPEGTFLWEYMQACCQDDSPEEYHFWNAMTLIGHALGRSVTLADRRPVVGNLLVCTLGGTGMGKSRAREHMLETIRNVMPFQENGTYNSGTKIVPSAGSGEFLIKSFQSESYDLSNPNPKAKGDPLPVNGFVDFDELHELVAKARRQGSSLQGVIMSLGDARHEVSTGSLTSGTFKAYNPFCSIAATTQPKSIRGLVSSNDASSGFLNRWVFVSGAPKERVFFDDTVINLDRAHEKLREIVAWADRGFKVRIDPAALPDIVEWYKTTIKPAMDNDESDLLKRLDLTFKKLMLLTAANKREELVDVDTLNRIKPLLQYLIDCYQIIADNVGVSLNWQIGEDIKAALRKHEDRFNKPATGRDLQKYLKNKKYSPDQIRKTLDGLVSIGVVDLVKPQQGAVGRPTLKYKLVA